MFLRIVSPKRNSFYPENEDRSKFFPREILAQNLPSASCLAKTSEYSRWHDDNSLPVTGRHANFAEEITNGLKSLACLSVQRRSRGGTMRLTVCKWSSLPGEKAGGRKAKALECGAETKTWVKREIREVGGGWKTEIRDTKKRETRVKGGTLSLSLSFSLSFFH